MPDIVSPNRPSFSATSDAPVIEQPAPVPETPPAAAAVREPDEQPDQEPPTEGAETEPPAAVEPPQLRKGRESAQDRIQAAIRDRRAAEARADRLADSLERALAALEQRTQQPAGQPAPAPKEAETPDPRPSRDQFADPDSYDAALVEWSARTATRAATAEFERRQSEARAAETAEQQRGQQQAQQAQLLAGWSERVAKLTADPQYADFEDVALAQFPVTEAMTAGIFQADNGPRVLYHLGQNRAEAERIAKLPPVQQMIEIGRLSATLEQASRPAPHKPPPNITPVGTRAAVGPKDPTEMTTEEYAAWRMEKLSKERRANLMWGRPSSAA